MQVREIDELKKEMALRRDIERTLERQRQEAVSLKSKYEAMLAIEKKKNIALENRVDNYDDVIMALKNAKNALDDELMRRKEAEEELARKNLETDALKTKHDENLEKMKIANKRKNELELQKIEFDNIVKGLNKEILEARGLSNILKAEIKELRKKFEDAVVEARELRQGLQSFSEYEVSDIKHATENFRNEIGRGGYGSVYKGQLAVAVKSLNPRRTQGQIQFRQEVSVLCKVRHPNIVILLGACSEICALVYEFLPNGDLADRLQCKNNTPPLTWRDRIRITIEICSALICLHSTKPLPIVHGDLKPQNILLDSKLISKLCDFGISRLLSQFSPSGDICHETGNPKGTSGYMDPEFIKTKRLKTSSDVYSFGVVVLVLVTGKSSVYIARDVKNAIAGNKFRRIIDNTAGPWPYVQVKELVNFALKCCDINPANRPVLDREVLHFIEAMLTVDSLPVAV